MFFVGLAGVLIGDATMFLAGRLFGYRIQRIRLFRRILSPRRFSQIQRKFKKYGLGLLFVARFLPGLRSPIYLVSGMSRRVSFITFILMDGMAALISVPVWIYLGYFFADNLDLLMVYVGDVQKAIYLALGLVIAIILVIYLKKRFHSKLNAIAGDEHTESTSSKTSSNTIAVNATANTVASNTANANTSATNTATASAQLANSSAQTLNSTLSAASNTESVKVASTAQTASKSEAQTITQTTSDTTEKIAEQTTDQSTGQSAAHSSEQATSSNANASGLNTAESNVTESNDAQTTEQSNDDGSSKDNGSAKASAIASARANSDNALSESQSQNTSTKADHKVELSPCGERAAKSTIREANSTVRIDPATESHEEILGKKIKDKKLISQLSKASSLAASGRGHSQFNPGVGSKSPQ